MSSLLLINLRSDAISVSPMLINRHNSKLALKPDGASQLCFTFCIEDIRNVTGSTPTSATVNLLTSGSCQEAARLCRVLNDRRSQVGHGSARRTWNSVGCGLGDNIVRRRQTIRTLDIRPWIRTPTNSLLLKGEKTDTTELILAWGVVVNFCNHLEGSFIGDFDNL